MARLISWILGLLILLGAIYWWRTTQDRDDSLRAKQHAMNFTDWHEYTDPDNQFKVRLPTLPHEAQQNVADPKTKDLLNYQIFVSPREDGSIYSISIIEFPHKEGVKYDDEFIKEYLDHMFKSNPKNTIKQFDMANFRQRRALNFRVENAEANVFGKAFLDGKTLYVLSLTTTPEQQAEDFDYFVNSFELVGAPSKPNKK
jgi:hypothetical protein